MIKRLSLLAFVEYAIIAIVFTAITVSSDDAAPIPEAEAEVNAWFEANVKPLADRKGTLNADLEAAEATPKTIKVRADGSGEFKTITDAVKSIPAKNAQRVIVDIGPGTYTEKITVEKDKPFVSFVGNTQLEVLQDKEMTVIVAQARGNAEDTGFSFVHCSVAGKAKGAYLGRAWMPAPKAVFAYSTISEVICPEGWSNNEHPEREPEIFFGEFKNSGPGAAADGRVKFAKQLTEAEVKPFISLSYIEGSKWLLPPPKLKIVVARNRALFTPSDLACCQEPVSRVGWARLVLHLAGAGSVFAAPTGTNRERRRGVTPSGKCRSHRLRRDRRKTSGGAYAPFANEGPRLAPLLRSPETRTEREEAPQDDGGATEEEVRSTQVAGNGRGKGGTALVVVAHALALAGKMGKEGKNECCR
ncbi:hypothetical protein JCGZ_03501 [Jatropha curcas]|uniref:pectinesterase n=1 Tax=Jatropha curcas TaxID=180498 RepID=A0A067L642_JATCU|nr:hypothetical protein JCGZ_03501 [Jatropha curcas]